MRRSTLAPESVVRPEIFPAASDDAPRRGGNRLPPPSLIDAIGKLVAAIFDVHRRRAMRQVLPVDISHPRHSINPAPRFTRWHQRRLPRTPIKAKLSPDLQRPVIAEDPKRFQLTM